VGGFELTVFSNLFFDGVKAIIMIAATAIAVLKETILFMLLIFNV
jgi:hypothetical protein